MKDFESPPLKRPILLDKQRRWKKFANFSKILELLKLGFLD